MSRKSDVISLLVTELKRINGGTDVRTSLPDIPYTYKSNVNNNVFSKFKFLQEINDFPTITLLVGTESRTHIGADVRYGNLNVLIQGYTRSEDVLNSADDLLEDIEHTINSLGFLFDFCPVDLVESRITSLATDEGLFEPFGIVQVNALIIYEVE